MRALALIPRGYHGPGGSPFAFGDEQELVVDQAGNNLVDHQGHLLVTGLQIHYLHDHRNNTLVDHAGYQLIVIAA